MQFNLKSEITDHSIDLNDIAERVIVGPQEEVLSKINAFNFRFGSDIRCTKTFRWEPGFYKKLHALQLKVMKLTTFPKNVKTAFNRISNNEWYARQLNRDVTSIDSMLYRLRSNRITFQDNSESVIESTHEWFNNIMSTTEVINNTDNEYNFKVYHAQGNDDMNKDYIVFIIEVDSFNMNIGKSTLYAPIKTGKVKMFIALDLVQIIGGAISGNELRFDNRYQHHGYHLGGQYVPLNKGLEFPYISSGRGYSSRVINYNEVQSYTRMDETSANTYEGSNKDGYTSLCFGDLKDRILKPMSKGRLDEVMFWLNSWGSFYNINTTGPLNNYTKMYYGSPSALYDGDMDGLLSHRTSGSCEYNLPLIQSESYCDAYECTMRSVCRKYENAYTVVDDAILAMREQILANYMISRGHNFETLSDEAIYSSRMDRALVQMNDNWSAAEDHINRMVRNIHTYFAINVDSESMLYIMASLVREISFAETIDHMEDYEMGADGFYSWLDSYYHDRTITPQIIPMETETSEHNTTSELERELLESYSASGRGIPIQVTETRESADADLPF
jgi:hypothetical protein